MGQSSSSESHESGLDLLIQIKAKNSTKLLDLNFQMTDKISSGAFGSVFIANDRETKKIYAVKIFHTSAKAAPKDTRAFRNEATTLKATKHPNIIKYFAHGTSNILGRNRQYLLTEFCDLGSLNSLIKSSRSKDTGKPTDMQFIDTFCQNISQAIFYIHDELQKLHLDIKPANILLATRGPKSPEVNTSPGDFSADRVIFKLGDFGCCQRIKNATSFPFSPPHSSPEVIKGEVGMISTTSDVFSFGATLFELSTLQNPS